MRHPWRDQRAALVKGFMNQHRISLGLNACLLALTALWGNFALAASCESLSDLKLPDTTIVSAKSVAAGTFTPPVPGARTAQPVAIAFCRVTGTIKPSSDSNIKFEVWLPQTGWTGRYESVGNGGFAGRIFLEHMVTPLMAGSAVAGTDDGHDFPPKSPGERVPEARSSWALGHPEKIIDYGYRAVHVTAQASKAITAAFYGSKPKYSYFVGCSKGGQEALMEAQRYPEDFDGIVGGAPANEYTKLFSSFAANMKVTMASEAAYISQADMKKIGAAVTEHRHEHSDHGQRHLVVTQPLPDAAPVALALLRTLEGDSGVGWQDGGIGHGDLPTAACAGRSVPAARRREY